MELRNYVVETTAVTSVLALGLVFATALGAIPSALLPRAPDPVLDAIPHVNAVLSLVAIGTITAGVRAIRRGNVDRHRKAMLASTSLFVTFLAAYLYKVAIRGPKPFPRPDSVLRFVYYPVLAIHILLAVVCVPLVIYALVLAMSHPIAELPETNHPRVGRIAAALWLVSFVLGTVVYLMLYVLF